MKIPKTVGYGMCAVGAAGMCASIITASYFDKKSVSLPLSPEHARVAEIEQQSSQLKDTVFVDCVPVMYELPAQDRIDQAHVCIDQKVNQYLSLQEEKAALTNNLPYIEAGRIAEEKKKIYQAHANGTLPAALLFLGLYGVGIVTVALRKREEEFNENRKKSLTPLSADGVQK